MAGKAAGQAGAYVGLCLAASLLLSAEGLAQGAPVSPMSPQCSVPSADIAAPAPLTNVTALLKQNKVVRILVVGSAATYAGGAAAKSYSAQLERLLEKALQGVDVEIVNRGVAGEVAETTAERIRSQVALAKPDLVLWQLGTNDAMARVPAEDFEATVRDAIRWLKENDVDVVLVGLQYTPRFAVDESYFAIRAALQKVASEEKVLYVRRHDAMQFIAKARAAETLTTSDDYHLNDLGYRCMAEHIAHAVVANLFVKPKGDVAP